MGIIVKETIKGAIYGVIGAIALIVLGIGFEIINCGCAIIACDCDREMIFDWSGIGGIFIFCIICGTGVGFVYGIFRAKEESDKEAALRSAESLEKARQQRVEWANTIKQKSVGLHDMCSSNQSMDASVVLTIYKTDSQMNEIMSELSKLAEIQGTVDSLIEELSQKGGISL